MTYRTLPLIAVTLVATMLPAHAAQTLNIDVIAEQGNRALEQIRAEAAQAASPPAGRTSTPSCAASRSIRKTC